LAGGLNHNGKLSLFDYFPGVDLLCSPGKSGLPAGGGWIKSINLTFESEGRENQETAQTQRTQADHGRLASLAFGTKSPQGVFDSIGCGANGVQKEDSLAVRNILGKRDKAGGGGSKVLSIPAGTIEADLSSEHVDTPVRLAGFAETALPAEVMDVKSNPSPKRDI